MIGVPFLGNGGETETESDCGVFAETQLATSFANDVAEYRTEQGGERK
jgi:hypothetical protein